MRVSMATGQPLAALWHAPYRRTLYEYFLIEQQARIDDLTVRSRALHTAGLIALAFHEPKRLRVEHHRLLAAAGLLPEAEAMRAGAASLVGDLRAAGWGAS